MITTYLGWSNLLLKVTARSGFTILVKNTANNSLGKGLGRSWTSWSCSSISEDLSWCSLAIFEKLKRLFWKLPNMPRHCPILIPTTHLRCRYTPNDNLALSLLHDHKFRNNANKVYIFWKLRNCRFRLLVALSLLPTFAGALRQKNRTRVNLNKILTNYIS